MLPRLPILIFYSVMVLIISCTYPDKIKADIPGTEYTQADSTKLMNAASGYLKGKYLFAQNCRACHYPPGTHMTDQHMFDNLFEKVPAPAEEYLFNYLSDSELLRASGNKYAIAVQKNWNSTFEHNFKDSLSRQELGYLITYLKIASANE